MPHNANSAHDRLAPLNPTLTVFKTVKTSLMETMSIVWNKKVRCSRKSCLCFLKLWPVCIQTHRHNEVGIEYDRRVLMSFERPVCPQTDAVRLLLNRAMKHLYLFVIDTGVAVLHKYEVGETLWSKVMWLYQWLYAPICIWYFTGTYFAPVSHYMPLT